MSQFAAPEAPKFNAESAGNAAIAGNEERCQQRAERDLGDESKSM